MRALEDMIGVLGQPVLMRSLGALAAIARWRHGGAVVEVAPSTTIRLATSLLDTRNARLRSGGSRTDPRGGGSVSIFAPEEGACIEVRGEADIVQLFVDQAQAEALLEAPLACPPLFDLHDDAMRALILRILVASARRGPDDALQVETDLHALARRIGGHAARTPPVSFRGGLAPAAFRRVATLIEAALDDAASPSLAELASAAGLSVTHFIRAFRRETGTTPHQYLVRRRMDRAVALLRSAKLPIGMVADTVGFATPAHFVARFHATMGVTPGALRAALAG